MLLQLVLVYFFTRYYGTPLPDHELLATSQQQKCSSITCWYQHTTRELWQQKQLFGPVVVPGTVYQQQSQQSFSSFFAGGGGHCIVLVSRSTTSSTLVLLLVLVASLLATTPVVVCSYQLQQLFVTTIPRIWIYPGAVFPNFRDIHILGLFDAFQITNSGMLKNHGIYLMLISIMNSLMLHRIQMSIILIFFSFVQLLSIVVLYG